MKLMLYLLVVSIITCIGCRREFKISKDAFHLIEPGNLKNFHVDVTCQFGENNVEIFTFKNKSKNIADVEIGVYSIDHGILTFPRGRFEIKKIGAGYQLSAKGELKYLLLTDAEFNNLTKALKLNGFENPEVPSESI
ncbi:hypothetical protein ACVWYG_003403 [Pedobacter sp. UYEF25]